MAPIARTLAHIPLFRTLDRPALQRLEALCVWRDAAPKQWITDHEGEGTDVFFVLRGQLRVIASVGGRDTILRDLHEGEFFGELAALDERPRSAGIQAVTNATLARMPATGFRRAIHDYPDVCDQILAVLVGQVRMLANRANETAGLNMKHRLWAELLRLGSPALAAPGNLVVSPPPTHAELAARVASHREAVTRELNALERSGLIARRRGAIELLDAGRLRKMVAEAGER
ncbi:MAG: Crp/Fnr family transcriptional regulator [Acetobacteraceae bacterium]|nr:Crp/Fnr family transcriptional regulator [Acetobacteraceae bacterium]